MTRCLMILLLFWCIGVSRADAQDASGQALIYSTDQSVAANNPGEEYLISAINVSGNNKTKEAVILRELPFASGNTYAFSFIASQFQEARQRLMNTGLFRNVVLSLNKLSTNQVEIQVRVEEKWYFYPIPFVKVVDGKFGQWWNEKGRSLDQLNYGIRLSQYNVTGRNDNLYVHLMHGYATQVSLEYKNLSLDKDLKWYAGFSLVHGRNREINYMTRNNKLIAAKNPDGYMRSYSMGAVEISYRPAIKTRHSFSVGYQHDKLADTINKLNAEFSGERQIMSYPVFGYSLFYNNVDFLAYPTKGFFGEAAISKKGLSRDMNLWQLSLKGNASFPVGKKDFLNLKTVGMVKLPFNQPYIHQQFLGYNDMFVQGYEDYVVDGVAGGYAKLAYHKPVFSTSIQPPQNQFTNKLRLFSPVPVKVYAKVFANAGYVYHPNGSPLNDLSNRMLYSAGVGLDIVAFADLIVKIEWSFNQLGQNGLYLHQRERF